MPTVDPSAKESVTVQPSESETQQTKRELKCRVAFAKENGVCEEE